MGCNFTESELNGFAKEYARRFWNREFDIKVELVNRAWKRRLAVYSVYNNGKKVIRMSKINNQKMSNEAVLGTLRHELVHWHLHTSGQDFSDDSEVFVAECIRVGAPISAARKAQEAYGEYIKKNLYAYFETLKKEEN